MWVNVPGPRVRPLGRLRCLFFDGAASHDSIYLKPSLKGKHRLETLEHELIHYRFNRRHPWVYRLCLSDPAYWGANLLFILTGFLPFLLPYVINMAHEVTTHIQTGTPKRAVAYVLVDGAILLSFIMLAGRMTI